MKTKDKKELFTKTTIELKKLLDEAIKAVASLKFDHQQSKLKDTRSIFNKGKEIAVLKSIMNMKSSVAKVMDDKKEEIEEVVKKAKGGSK